MQDKELEGQHRSAAISGGGGVAEVSEHRMWGLGPCGLNTVRARYYLELLLSFLAWPDLDARPLPKPRARCWNPQRRGEQAYIKGRRESGLSRIADGM